MPFGWGKQKQDDRIDFNDFEKYNIAEERKREEEKRKEREEEDKKRREELRKKEIED